MVKDAFVVEKVVDVSSSIPTEKLAQRYPHLRNLRFPLLAEKSVTPRLFADDTCLILQHKNLADLNVKINTEMKAIENYRNANKLTLNISKSNVIVINSNSKNNNLTSDLIASKLSLVQNARYLGVLFDNCLSFKNHITLLEKKLSRAVGILAKIKPFLNRKTLLSLSYAIFHSNLHYGLITWGSTYKSYLKKLSVLQNKAVKIVGGRKYYERATPFYSQLKFLKLEDLIRLETAVLVFKIKNKALPAQFYNYINEVGYISKKSTRANTKKNYFIPFFKKNKITKINKISRSTNLELFRFGN